MRRNVGRDPATVNRREAGMTDQPAADYPAEVAEHHRKAAEHYTKAAERHMKAAEGHESGNVSTAAEHAQFAHGHHVWAKHYMQEAAKWLAEPYHDQQKWVSPASR